jgi:hypothetical protein
MEWKKLRGSSIRICKTDIHVYLSKLQVRYALDYDLSMLYDVLSEFLDIVSMLICDKRKFQRWIFFKREGRNTQEAN